MSSFSEAQYEARFRLWNIRKKIRNREWNVILPQLEKRAQDGKQTQIVLNNVELNEERIAREISRRLPNCNIDPGKPQRKG